jgi:ADP-ribose pyrophosphatase
MEKGQPDTQPAQDYRVEIKSEWTAYSYRDFFRILHAELRYRLQNGRMSALLPRLSFERGDSVGMLLYDPEQDQVVLTRQFRYPVYAGLSPQARAGEGARQAWVLEVVAGMLDGDSSAPKVAKRELLEEVGYVPTGDLTFIATVYVSPGGTSERVHLYLGQINATQPVEPGGGLEDEGEDIEAVVLPLQEAFDMIGRGEIQDAKTILCLQYLALHRNAP